MPTPEVSISEYHQYASALVDSSVGKYANIFSNCKPKEEPPYVVVLAI